jgi:N6-adenosine-specific RNA methylase IME4
MGGAIDHYNTMSLEDIKDLSVKELAEDNAVLFMWATAPLLEEAFEVVNAWGFKYNPHSAPNCLQK